MPFKIIGLFNQAIEFGYTYVEKVSDLVLEGSGVEPVEVYDPEAGDVEFQADPDDIQVLTCDSVTLEKKKDVVMYWRGRNDGKKRKFTQVQNKFRFVTQVGSNSLVLFKNSLFYEILEICKVFDSNFLNHCQEIVLRLACF